MQPIIFLAIFALAQACHLGNCQSCPACGLGSGEDMCQQRQQCSPLVVRPVEVPRPASPPVPRVVCTPVGGVPPLLPLGGPCSCQRATVTPAVVPKPPCNCGSVYYTQQSSQQCQNSHNSQQQNTIVVTGGNNRGNNAQILGGSLVARPVLVQAYPTGPQNQNPSQQYPADAVSIALAQKSAQQACRTSEDILSFGFRTLPKDVPQVVQRRTNNIAEENLYSLNGQIVELKPVACTVSKTLDEEAIEELMELAEEEQSMHEASANSNYKQVSLGELGYAPAKIQAAPFIDVPVANLAEAAAEDALQAVHRNDGFVPGTVAITPVQLANQVSRRAPLPEPCDDDDDVIPPMPVMPPNGPNNGPYTYLSSSSSSSSQSSDCNNRQSTVMLQRLNPSFNSRY